MDIESIPSPAQIEWVLIDRVDVGAGISKEYDVVGTLMMETVTILVVTAIEPRVIVVGTVAEVVRATENVTGWYGSKPRRIVGVLATWSAEIGMLDRQNGSKNSKAGNNISSLEEVAQRANSGVVARSRLRTLQ
jgi:hypothetical protein